MTFCDVVWEHFEKKERKDLTHSITSIRYVAIKLVLEKMMKFFKKIKKNNITNKWMAIVNIIKISNDLKLSLATISYFCISGRGTQPKEPNERDFWITHTIPNAKIFGLWLRFFFSGEKVFFMFIMILSLRAAFLFQKSCITNSLLTY